ncbi:SEC10/PgrA surface exclusion domain-containing protein, partial [Limosilactobacillus reuteri]
MNKKQVLSLTGAALATVAGVSVANEDVNADVKTTTGNAQTQQVQSQTADQQAQAKVDSAQANVNSASTAVSDAQSQLNSASAANTAAQGAVSDQQKVVDSAQANVNSASTVVSDAQASESNAQKNADQATPANIQKAQDAIVNQEAQISKDTDAINDANKAVSDAQSTVNAAQKEVNDATTARDNQQKNVDTASDTVKNAQAILDNSDQAKKQAQDALDKANQKVADDTVAVNNKQTDVNNATKAKKNADEALKNANDAQTSAQKNKDAKQAIADEASTALADANAAVKDAQAKVDAINDKLANFNTITLPAGYKEALNAYNVSFSDDNWSKEKSDSLSKQLEAIASKGNKLNTYKHNKEDENKIVDFNNLTQEEAKDLAVYYAALVNQVRNAFGTDKVVVTPSSVKFTLQLIKEGYNEVNWDAFGEHMTDGKNHNFQYLRNYGDNHNTTVLENMYGGLTSWGFGEDGLYKITPNNNQTMDSLKETLYEGLVGYLFDDADSGWGHANTALDLSVGHSMGKEAMAIGFDKYGYSHSEYYRLDNNNNIAADAYQLPDISMIQEELDKVNTVLQSTKADQASKQKANDNAQNALSSANQVLVVAQNDVKDKTAAAQKTNDNLTTAQNNLATLQSQLSADQANQKQAQTTFDSFDADLATKQANLQKATDSLKAEQGRLAIAQAD